MAITGCTLKGMADDTESTPAAEFAALMTAAAEEAGPPDEAPYGYTTDKDGTRRPKKTPGRPRRSPSADELRQAAAERDAAAAADGGQAAPPADRAPDDRRRRGGRRPESREAEPPPAYRPGVITRGVNKLYRKAGKIVRAMDADIGEAIIQAARNTSEEDGEDDSVGAAWDELAKANPRVRKFLMRCLAGGAWGQLLMAHAPIAMAIIMKPAIMRLIPFARLIESLAEPDDDTMPGEGGLPGGMTAADAAQVRDLAMGQMARMGLSIPPEVAEQMMAAAQAGMMGMPFPVPGGPPPQAARSQPRSTTRAQRRKAG
jgi:hypothetical protein